MTLNLSGGREQRLLWGISSSNPSEFLGDLADDPAVANLLKNSACPLSLSAPGSGTEAIKAINGGSIATEHRRSSFNADDLLNTTPCESRGGVSRSTLRDRAGPRSPPVLVEADCASTPRRTNGWTASQRPQALLQNGLGVPTIQHIRTLPSPISSAHPLLTSPSHPPPTYHTPSPHSTTPPLPNSHSPHYLHRTNSSAASSPATPTNESCGSTLLSASSRTQPMAPSPFIATRLPSSLPVNMLTQLSNYDLVDTVVTLKPTSRDVIMHGQVGVVKRVTTNDMASVHLLSTGSDIHVPCSSLEPIRPRQKDVVKVIGGTHCLGRIGTLMSVIGEHGIVKFMRGDNIAQIPLRNLGRYAPTRESGVKAVDYLRKSASSASSTEQSPSSREVTSESPFDSINSSTTATTNFPFVALHYPGSAFPLLIPGASPQGGSYVSLSGTTLFPSSVTATNDITENSSPYTSTRIFPSMISPFMISPSQSESNSSNGIGTRNGLSSHSSSTSSDQLSSLFPHSSLSFMYPPPVLAGGRTIKSDVTSPTETTTPFSSDGGPSPSFSFVRQDSTERDSVRRTVPTPDGLLRPSHFYPSQQHSSHSGRPSVIQSSSNQSGADPKQHPSRHKGLLQPSSAIEKAKAFMATAMGVCPPSNRGGGACMVAKGGGGGASPMTRVHQDGRLAGESRAPPPYPTSAKLGGRVSSGGSHDHHSHHQVKMNPEERIKYFIEKLVQHRRSYAYRRNSGEGDVKTSCIRISLVCPLSQKRMSYPCRGNACRHHQCFDADAYVRYNIAQKVKKKLMKHPSGKSCVQQINKKWQCPICHSHVPANQLYIDKDIFTAVKESSAVEVELGDDGSWRPVQKEEKKIEVIDLTDLDD